VTPREKVAEAVAGVLERHGILLVGDWIPELGGAAIEAMRSPNKRMLKAAAKAMSPAKRPTQKRVSVARKHAIRYVSMIDAALEEKP